MSIPMAKRFVSIVLNGNRYKKSRMSYGLGLACALCDLRKECARNSESHNLGRICGNITILQEYWLKADDVKESR